MRPRSASETARPEAESSSSTLLFAKGGAFAIMSRERGARRERLVFGEDDDALYRDLLASQCRKHGRRGLLPIGLTPNPRSSHSRPRPRAGARARARL
jgi:hypothetical protein